MKDLFQFLTGFFREDSKASSTRLIDILTSTTILSVWAYSCYMKALAYLELVKAGREDGHALELVPLPETIVVIFLGTKGIKFGQKWLEKNGNGNGNGHKISAPANTNETQPPPVPAGPPPPVQ